jgi:hypothetical protein
LTRRPSGAAPSNAESLVGRVKPGHGEIRNWFKAGLSVLFCLAPLPALAACADDEATLFSCLAEDQAHTIELCAVRDDAAGGYQSLQYHYGTADKVELSFPADRRDGRDAMAFAHAFDKDQYVWSLRFANGGFTYRIFGLGDDAGVEVWKNKKRLAQVMCGARPYAYPDDMRRAASCDLKNPFGKAGCADSPPTRK